MHGFVLNELERFLDLESGLGTWAEARRLAGAGSAPYAITSNYPDDEAIALVLHAAALTNRELPSFLFEFGAFLAGGLLSVYGPFIDASWGFFDVLEHTEESIHTAVRLNDPAARPPHLRVERVGERHARIDYVSQRQLCDLAKGIVKGLSDHYQAPVRIEDVTCMRRGDPACQIDVRSEPAP